MNISTKAERIKTQLALLEYGYDPGPVDGIWGPASKRAYAQYLKDSVVDTNVKVIEPETAVPWWKARRTKGLIVMGIGGLAVFIPALREMDTSAIIDLLWSNMDLFEKTAQSIGAVITVLGTIWGIIGSKDANAPIDPSLVATIGGKEIRLPITKSTQREVERIKREREDEKIADIVNEAKGTFGEIS